MRCHFSDKDATICDPSGLNIWTANVHNPSVLESVENLTGKLEYLCCNTFLSFTEGKKKKVLDNFYSLVLLAHSF